MQVKTETNILDQGLILHTLIGNNQSVYAFYAVSKENSSRYYINLKSENGESLGEMDVLIVDAHHDITTFMHPYKNLKYLYIKNMENNSRHKHVGYALHEYAFRMAVAHGAEGRIRFAAVRDTHIFHYKNGFLLEGDRDASFINYYLSMAEEMLKSGKSSKDLGSHDLYLPTKYINEKYKKYRLEELLVPSEERLGETDKISFAEKINFEIQHKSVAIEFIIGLYKGFIPPTPINNRNYSKKFFKEYRADCQFSKDIIETGLEGLIQELPLDTEEKQLKFDLILVGVIILVMTFQDHQYGKQSIFNNEYLFPQITFNQITDKCSDDMTLIELILSLGEDALLKKTLSLDGILKPNAFYGLQAISEFPNFINKYDAINKII
ncbi:MAG: hypothetical protein H0U73_02285 [Tatlockia sp.]|nr:hypothetical protein [Tatlockia sp.]